MEATVECLLYLPGSTRGCERWKSRRDIWGVSSWLGLVERECSG